MALSPTSSRASGGGTAPITREQVFGTSIELNNGISANLSWDTPSGSTLLSRTDPLNPTVITAGVYAVTISTQPSDFLTAGGAFGLQLDMDANVEDAACHSEFAAPSVNGSVSLTYYVPAGGVIAARVDNHDGVKALTFSLNAIVQRIS